MTRVSSLSLIHLHKTLKDTGNDKIVPDTLHNYRSGKRTITRNFYSTSEK